MEIEILFLLLLLSVIRFWAERRKEGVGKKKGGGGLWSEEIELCMPCRDRCLE